MGSVDLGERRHGKIGMEGKFDSFEQLFPWVHDPDANAVRGPLPYRATAASIVFRVLGDRQQWIGGTGRWRVQDPAWAADRRRRGVVDRHSLRWPRRPACQHLRHRRDRHHRRRTRRARPRRFATGSSAAAGPIDHRLVGRFALAVPQSGNGVGGGCWNASTRPPNHRHRRAGRPARRLRRCASGWQPSDRSPSAS